MHKTIFGSSFHLSTKKIVVKVGPPLTKFSGSAHASELANKNVLNKIEACGCFD